MPRYGARSGPEKGELTMRLFRPVLGMLLLTIGLPALLAGGCLWAALRHRDAGGAFSAELQRLSVPGYAIVVPDVGRLLRDDASFARIGGTELRVTALTAEGPAFVGLAPAGAVEGYLRDVPHTDVRGVQVGTGELPISAARVDGDRRLPSAPGHQDFWTRTGGGALRWTPGELSGRYSLVIMNATGAQGLRLNGTVEVRPGWLDPTAWGLLSLGALLAMAGVITLAVPGRRREVVYIVEPSQVPDLMLAIGAPLPRLGLEGGARRALPGSGPSQPGLDAALSGFDPALAASDAALAGSGAALAGSGGALAGSGGALAGSGAALAGSGAALAGSGAALAGSGAALAGFGAGSAGSDAALAGFDQDSIRALGGRGGLFGFGHGGGRGLGQGGAHRPRTLADAQPVRPPALPQFAWPPKHPGGPGGDSLPLSSGTPTAPAKPTAEPAPAPATVAGVPSGVAGAGAAPGVAHTGILPGGTTPVVPGALPIPSPAGAGQSAPEHQPASPGASHAGAVADPGTAGADTIVGSGTGAAAPVPGRPLSLLGTTPAGADLPGAPPRPDRPGRRRLPAPTDLPEFHATAVGAWVAQTAPERARQTEAQAAAALAEAARNRTTKPTGDPASAVREQASAMSAQPAAPDPTGSSATSDSASSPVATDSARPSAARDSVSSPVATDSASSAVATDATGSSEETASVGKPERDSGESRQRDQKKGDGNRKGGIWPAPAPRRVALLTGPGATDWSATGLTRMGSRPSPKSTPPSPANPVPSGNAEAVSPSTANPVPSGNAEAVSPGAANSVPSGDANAVSPGVATMGEKATAAGPAVSESKPAGPAPQPGPKQPVPSTSAAHGAARVAAAAGAAKVAAAQGIATTALAEAGEKPSPQAPGRQRVGESTATASTSIENPAPAVEPEAGPSTEPAAEESAPDAPTQPNENRPSTAAQPTEGGLAAGLETEATGSEPVDDAATTSDEAASTEPRETEATTDQQLKDEHVADEVGTGKEADDSAPETETRGEPKPPIVPFPTRQPTASPHPVPTARAAESDVPAKSAGIAEPAGIAGPDKVAEPAGIADSDKVAGPVAVEPRADDEAKRASIHEAEAGQPVKAAAMAGPTRALMPKQAGERKVDEQKADERKADERKADERKADEQKAEEQKAEEQKADERPSMHAMEAGTAEQTSKPQTKTAAKRAAESNRPLSRAQDRLTGAARQGGTTAGRKVPAAWLKAAETVAARAATQTGSTPPSAEATAPADATTAAGQGGSVVATAGEAVTVADEASTAASKTAAGKAAADEATVNAEEAPAARKPRPRTKTTRTAAEKKADSAEAEKAARTPSYREEAAELLAAATERKRRRPTPRSRPKTEES
ncbi:hypothetical protein ACTOB_000994 [Actinoplanes oblitus]|uniref:Uncharacterized protein n=1 Tax=Actinoplanes oblitus TaxID=3040509 RepID=A0ABY8WNW0_9ACTN|nr:hypothetical protein [Actinoplanes oblitus]WIM97470.1 hypothetical protein ACTOB_000994 [Actinoplanes oblitus]